VYWLGLIIGGMLRRGVRNEWEALKRGALVGGAFVAGVAAMLNTHRETQSAPGRPVLPAVTIVAASRKAVGQVSDEGRCYLRGSVNGTPITFLVDPAIGMPSFSRDQVRDLGIDPAKLRYGKKIYTENGIGRAAAIQLAEIRIGDLVLHDVSASVNYNGQTVPQLGVSVLRDFHLDMGHGSCSLRE
jgi:clan AA aspartic protease (TIGR02281 family)